MQPPVTQPQAILFDMDGVLVSSERVHWKAYRDTFASEGVEYPWEAYRATGLGISRENVMKKVLGQLEEEKLLELMKRKEDHVRTILDAEKVERVPGALEFVKEARRHGLKTAVATSSRSYSTRSSFSGWAPGPPHSWHCFWECLPRTNG